MKKQSTGLHTTCIHKGQLTDDQFGGAISPIYLATSYPYLDVENKMYPRYFNTPNQEVLNTKMAALENAESALIFSSGMAAISTALLTFLKSGDHVILQNEIYGGTYNLVVKEFDNLGISYSFTQGVQFDDFEQLIQSNTKMVYTETPSNPLLSIVDLKRLSTLCKRNGILTMTDNTFASPINQRPLDLGVDIVVHSATKYLGGHSDISAGVVAASADAMSGIMEKARNFGGNLSEFTCYLLERSIKTLALRIDRHNANAEKMASWLIEQPYINKVYYPGLTDHPGHDIASAQMNGYGGMLSFELNQGMDAKAFQERLQMIKPSMSLAGLETTIIQPSLTSHALMSKEERTKQGISDQLLRLSVGLEDVDDIKADIKQAIN